MAKTPLKYLIIALSLSFLVVVLAGIFLAPQLLKKEEPVLKSQYTYLSEPKISANNQFAYVKGDNLFIANIDGSNTKQLTSYPVVKDVPTHKSNKITYFEWSPDGKEVAYIIVADPAKQTQNVFIFDINNNNVSLLTLDNIDSLHWFDEGIILTKEEYQEKKEGSSPISHHKFYLLDVNTGKKEVLIELSDYYLSIIDYVLSHNKTKLAYTSMGPNWPELWVMDLFKNNNNNQFTDYNLGDLGKLSWSPSGQFLAYEVYGLSGNSFVSIYDITQKVDISYNPEGGGGHLGKKKSLNVVNIFQSMAMEDRKPFTDMYYNRWLQDDRLLFITMKYAKGENKIDIWTIGPKGDDLKYLGSFSIKDTGSDSRWQDIIYGISISHNLKKVIFKKSFGKTEHKKQAIYSINIDGSGLKEIANNEIQE